MKYIAFVLGIAFSAFGVWGFSAPFRSIGYGITDNGVPLMLGGVFLIFLGIMLVRFAYKDERVVRVIYY